MRKDSMTELQRRLSEAASRLEKQYEDRRAELGTFERELLAHLKEQIGGWTTSLDGLVKSVEALQKRQDQLEADQRTLAEHLAELATAFETYASERERS